MDGFLKCTHIRVVSDLLDGVIIEMARVAHEVGANLVGVLQAAENIIDHRELAALAQLDALIFASAVDLLNPGLVVRGR